MDTPGTAKLPAQAVVTQLQSLGQQLPDIAPLTPDERLFARRQGKVSQDVVAATVTVIGASEMVQQGIGEEPDTVRQLLTDADDWDEVERQLKALLKGVQDANLVRRQRAAVIASRAYLVAQQVVRDPANAGLRPHLEEVKRLRNLTRRAKPAKQTPEPQPNSTPAVPDAPKQ